MHKIMVLNAKGGCGKTTIATTLACYFASHGYNTALMDFDPQQSSNRWLGIRSEDQPQIKAIDGVRQQAGVTRSFQLYSGNETEIVIIDTPAGVTGGKLVDLYHKADSILIPVMPSIIDLQAMQIFLQELSRLLRQGRDKKHVGVIANRVRMRGKSYHAIESLMKEAGLPLVAVLRDTQNYSLAMEAGLGVCELKPGVSAKDRMHWEPILDWLFQIVPAKQQSLELTSPPRGNWPSAVA
jgi:chromosome partitioning protein